MDFKSFKQNKNAQTTENEGVNSESVRQAIDDYSKKSEQELMEELSYRYKKEIENGMMDKARLEKIVGVLDSFLNETQREKLKNIVDNLSES